MCCVSPGTRTSRVGLAKDPYLQCLCNWKIGSGGFWGKSNPLILLESWKSTSGFHWSTGGISIGRQVYPSLIAELPPGDDIGLGDLGVRGCR